MKKIIKVISILAVVTSSFCAGSSISSAPPGITLPQDGYFVTSCGVVVNVNPPGPSFQNYWDMIDYYDAVNARNCNGEREGWSIWYNGAFRNSEALRKMAIEFNPTV